MSRNDNDPPKPDRSPDGKGIGGKAVGKGSPPESGKFRVGDGRPRGRRPKGTHNLATDFREEMQDLVTVTQGGKQKRITKQRALVMRLVENASRGQHGALKLAFEYGGRFAGTPGPGGDAVKLDALLPDLDKLTRDELREFSRLLGKAAGQPVEAGPVDMFAYVHDPEDPRNYCAERTVDGLLYDRSLAADFPDRLNGIENGAYRSAAGKRLPGCNRRTF